MSKTSTIRFFDIENPNVGLIFFVVNENIPDQEISKLSDDAEEVEIYKKIHQYVVVEKHFLDKDISINIIMDHCHVDRALLNKILRQRDKKAFHGYINKHRVIYAAALLLDPSNKLIEVVAMEASFNNVRTFVRNFKTVYNMTPSEYRRFKGFKYS